MSTLRRVVRVSLALTIVGGVSFAVAGRAAVAPQALPHVAAPVAAQPAPPSVAQQAPAAASRVARHTPHEREDEDTDGDDAADARERFFEANEKKFGPRPDHPGEAIAYRRLSLIDENGYIPPDGLMKAKQHADMMRAQARLAPTAGISKTTWTWKGPGNIGGRTRAIAINPSNSSVIFAGTVGGGIWKTTTGGTSWAVVDDFMANLAVTSILFQPGNPSVMYAGTGEGFFNGDAIRGAGIFKSTDGGTTWTQLSATANSVTSNFNYVNRLAFSADGSVLLAATRAGFFKSVDGGATWSGPSVSPTNGAADVKFLPGSSTAAVGAGLNGTAYYSTNAGTSWTAASPTAGSGVRIELAVSPSASNNVYAVADTSSGALYKSTNGGVTYTLVSTPGHLNGQGWYDNVIWVAPDNDNTIVVGGVDLWRSTDGGATFTKISNWAAAPNSAHADQHAIVSDPNFSSASNPLVYFGNDGGVYKAANVLTVTSASGGGFTSLNNSYGPTQFYGASGNASTGRITGGTQDNGDLFLATSAGTSSWADRFGGDGGYSAYDPTDANTFYGEYVYLTVHRNTSGGSGFSSDIWGPTNSSWVACKAAPYRIDDACASMISGFGSGGANFIAPFILDPNDPNTMLAGGRSLWRTNDVKTATTSTTGPSWTNIRSVTSGTNYINAITVAPGNSNVIYVGYNNGDIYMTTNGTSTPPTWTKIDSASMPNSQVQRIAVDPLNTNNVYAAFGGYTSTNFWKSTDGGTTWALSVGSGSTGLPAAPIRGIAIHPTISGYLYVGTEVGVFASTDGGATWGTQDGPANVSVNELSWMGSTLIAATHGRGVYTAAPAATFNTAISVDSPAANAQVTAPFTVSGWAINQGATSGTGVKAVHIYIQPSGGALSFLGVATYGAARSDIGALYGTQFTNSGFSFSGGTGLAAGNYTLYAYAQNASTNAFDAVVTKAIAVVTPTSKPHIAVDSPTAGQVVTSAFEVGGWALDAGAPSGTGTGVDAVTFYIQPAGAAAPGIFVGTGSYGWTRTDLAAIYGSQFTNVGFHFTITGMSPGTFTLNVYAHSTVTNTNSILQSVPITVSATALMSIDAPSPEATITANTFLVGGWSIDRSVESTAQSGTGVQTLHVYAYPNPGSNQPPIFLGVATTGVARTDVGAAYGTRYNNSGYQLIVDRTAAGLAPGVYNIVVHSMSSVSGTFNNDAVVRVTIQ